MLAPFQATHGALLRFPHVCRFGGFLPWLVSDLFLLVDLLVLFCGFFISFFLGTFLKNLTCKRVHLQAQRRARTWKGGQQREIERDLPFYLLVLSSFSVEGFPLSSFLLFHFEFFVAYLVWVCNPWFCPVFPLLPGGVTCGADFLCLVRLYLLTLVFQMWTIVLVSWWLPLDFQEIFGDLVNLVVRPVNFLS